MEIDSVFFNIKTTQRKKIQDKSKFSAPLVLLCTCVMSIPSHAAYTIGEKDDHGQLKVSGALRAKYVYNFDQDNSKSQLDFSDAVLWLDYESTHWLGRLDYRFYEFYGHVGDASWLTDAWLGYKIDEKSKIVAGVNPVPFGLGRFWGNNYYLGIANAAGLEDVHRLGIKYDYNDKINEFQLAYYPTDAGKYVGHSRDSKHFSITPVDADDYVPHGTNTKESNAVIVRAAHTYQNVFNQDQLTAQLGVSGWYSDIENRRSKQDGDRQVWSVFSNINYKQWNLQALAAHQDIDNADLVEKDHITLGGFDGSFNSAVKGQIYSAELSYLFPNQIGPFSSVRPYLNYSSYVKDQDHFKTSTRIIPGVAFSYQKLIVQAELLLGKHDPYVGDSEGLAAGGDQDQWYKRAYVSIGYYF